MLSLRQRETINLDCRGGLGNQMFMYAAGLYFAGRFGKQLEIVKPPISGQRYGNYSRPFQLTEFRIPERVRESDSLDRFCFSRNPRLRNIQSFVARRLNSEIILEPVEHKFHADLQGDPDRSSVYLCGYWQAFGYVAAMELQLRERFVLQSDVGRRTQEYSDRILREKCAVSVHLRLGDYAQILHSTGQNGVKVSNVLSLRYYERAITEMQARYEGVTLIVFSDEPSVARAIMKDKGSCVFIEGNDSSRAHEDMGLMSLCRHHIIANSSFSWWGAWLSQTRAKEIYAPRYWTNNRASYYSDLYPPGCRVIDNLE